MSQNDPRVLIVEDSEAMRQLTGFALRRQLPGVQVVEAENGLVALQLLAKQAFDVVLLDVNMPIMSGLAVLSKLPQLPHPPAAIMVTTEGAAEDVQRAMALGAAAYVTKPVRAMDIAPLVMKTLRERGNTPG